MRQINLGPVTRIEGHLNIHTTVENGAIVDAKCSTEMFRGFEMILRGRDPLDAQQITQRICGVCPYAHGIAASYAQEAAYGLAVPKNGRILHNLIQGANHLYDYLLNFYQLSALDYVDVTSVLRYQGRDEELLHVKQWVKAQLDSGMKFPGTPFLPRLPGPYITNVELNIGALKHYLEALTLQRKANQAVAIFGGKFPHSTAIFPGGCSQNARVELITAYQSLIREVRDFINDKYLPDIVAVAEIFPEYWHIGASKGGFLSYGQFPLSPALDSERFIAPGVLLDGKVRPVDFDRIRQDVKYARYDSGTGLSVRESDTSPSPQKQDAYTWTKAPRYDGRMVEVGPAARVMIDYLQGHNEGIRKRVDAYAASAGIRVEQLNSVLGRHLSRGILGAVIADFLLEESDRIDADAPTMAPLEIPESGEGFGATEASRGALLHYVRIANQKIDMYECVVPTTWNCSPRDDRGHPGAMESALIGTKIRDPEEQIEALRVVRSLDPCIACSVH
jgi:ferredoxin hydrogenase large subunit/hydrogenase large subunit